MIWFVMIGWIVHEIFAFLCQNMAKSAIFDMTRGVFRIFSNYGQTIFMIFLKLWGRFVHHDKSYHFFSSLNQALFDSVTHFSVFGHPKIDIVRVPPPDTPDGGLFWVVIFLYIFVIHVFYKEPFYKKRQAQINKN